MKWVKFIRKKGFITIILNLNNKAFVIYIAFFTNLNLSINNYLFYKVQTTFFKVNNILIVVLSKYYNFTNNFFLDFIGKFLEYIKINNHLINLTKD